MRLSIALVAVLFALALAISPKSDAQCPGGICPPEMYQIPQQQQYYQPQYQQFSGCNGGAAAASYGYQVPLRAPRVVDSAELRMWPVYPPESVPVSRYRFVYRQRVRR